ncbi:mitochondrial ribonuclease P protein 1 homolog [Copidosoma floridanum]|uniref:mitochondrial ribonuclease P protein 1 homolog n=1 Tax=Copidosoma floridanum TaxID=29053 RepID=UPI0006C96D68|nr:mitochondrial ribonuclease P protein 1 homolog [Copidosoma floridanum]
MYSHAIRCILNVSAKLRKHKDLKDITLIYPTLIFARQQVLAYKSFHISAHHDIEEKLYIPRDQKERKNHFNDEAQKKIDAMVQENPELTKFMEVVKLEIELLRQNGVNVPLVLKPAHWLEILSKHSKKTREKYYDFLFKLEKKVENRKIKQEKNQELYEIYKQERDTAGVKTDVMVYGIARNCMFRRISDQTMNQLWNWNSLKSVMWGNKIVFDFSYEQYMNPQEIKSCAKQIMGSYAVNRLHNFPFNVYLCNVNLKGLLMTSLAKFIPTLFDDDFPWTVSSKSFIELFDKDSVVYLTGNSNKTLEKYDHNSVYIIGAFVDKCYKQPVSLAKAKQLGISTAKLPLDRYLHFGDGSNKNLTLNNVMSIMLDAQFNNWEKALEHVPKRKLFESRLRAMERKLERDMGKARILKPQTDIDFGFNAQTKLRKQFNSEIRSFTKPPNTNMSHAMTNIHIYNAYSMSNKLYFPTELTVTQSYHCKLT